MQEVRIQGTSNHQVLWMVIAGLLDHQIFMKEITIKLTDKEYRHYVAKGQSEYRRRMK